MLYLSIMKIFTLIFLFSLGSMSWAANYYPLDSPENTPLFVAIATGDFKKAENLLKNGANLTERSVKNATVFTALALNNNEQGSINFLPKLTIVGSFINAQDDYGATGLQTAIYEHKYRLAQAFIQNKDINLFVRGHGRIGILHVLAHADFKNQDAVQLLNMILARGGVSLINDQDRDGRTMLHYALAPGKENLELLEILAKRTELNTHLKDKDGNVAILLALTHISRKLDDALYPWKSPSSISEDFQHIKRTSQALRILLLSSLEFNLKIENRGGLSPEFMISKLKEELPTLPKDSPVYEAFEPIRTVLL